MDVFLQAAWRSPSVIFFDDIDQLCPSVDEQQSDSSRSYHIAMILCDLAVHFMERYQVTVLATAIDETSIQKYFLESFFFGTKLKLVAPSRSQRSEVDILSF
jgi:SpoVK/Ycf46/Vps4 family AAA+-type ATPase